ncbi:hypothetical protein [Aeromonas veronii]|uniref:hypothetical protein n=1 Tax=Aeromonas veronii TaxID=654 RepID=UPI001431313B|nr:hypothetical protein [Aeromonas veronii]NJI08498.1 hypothetical protein [Aeromonas veronii]
MSRDGEHPFQSKAASVAFFYIGGCVRIGWLLLCFPSLAFAIAGCPVGVQLGNVTVATNLPVCLKFDGSQLGGCIVDCKGVCVELPLANKKGPVETTGAACDWTENGSGNGDSDGSGNTPGEGGSSGNGGLPKDWDFFNPVIGDATGTSVSATIAKLNKNLGKHIGAFSENSQMIYQRVNELTGDSRRIVNASEAAQQYLKEIAEYNRVAGHKRDGFELYLSRMEPLLREISINTANTGSASGATGTGSNMSKDFEDKLFGTLDSMRYGSLNNIDFKMSDVKGHLAAIEGALGRNGMAGNVYAMRQMMEKMSSGSSGGGSTGGGSTASPNQEQLFNMLEAINDNISRTGGTTANNSGDLLQAFYELQRQLASGEAGGSQGGGDGSGLDYSKMPGSGDNPLSVKEGKYSSACSGDNCFFDVPGMEKKLAETNKSLADKYTSITEDVKQVFSFNLTGSADPMECLDLFTHQGKEYTVCPPSGDYWKTLAALMLFIFYFVALMIILKR